MNFRLGSTRGRELDGVAKLNEWKNRVMVELGLELELGLRLGLRLGLEFAEL